MYKFLSNFFYLVAHFCGKSTMSMFLATIIGGTIFSLASVLSLEAGLLFILIFLPYFCFALSALSALFSGYLDF